MKKIFWMSVSLRTPPEMRWLTDSPVDLITIDDEIVIDNVSHHRPTRCVSTCAK